MRKSYAAQHLQIIAELSGLHPKKVEFYDKNVSNFWHLASQWQNNGKKDKNDTNNEITIKRNWVGPKRQEQIARNPEPRLTCKNLDWTCRIMSEQVGFGTDHPPLSFWDQGPKKLFVREILRYDQGDKWWEVQPESTLTWFITVCHIKFRFLHPSQQEKEV